MKDYIAKAGIRRHVLYGDDGTEAAYIRKENGGYGIYRPEKSKVCTVQYDGKSSINAIYDDGEKRSVLVSFSADKGIVRPPMAHEADYSKGLERISLIQEKDRSFTVKTGGRNTGKITGILSRKTHIVLNDDIDSADVAFILALSLIMESTDDVIVV